jgi:uncharacterized small protein (TIGR04563 family)
MYVPSETWWLPLTDGDPPNYNHAHTLLTRMSCGVKNMPMAGSDKRKQSLYFPEDMLKEIQDEATRQDRSLSWIVQKAWKIARKEIMKYPSVNEFPGEEDEREAKGD